MTPLATTDGLTSWGRVQRGRHAVARPRWRSDLPSALRAVAAHPGRGLAVGLSRSYGDSGLNPGGAVIAMAGLDRAHAFDRETGVLRADAGLSLDDLIRIVLPHGWFPAVVPGTRFVTLGGAIANDVHGKNHHRAGTFGRHVRRLALLRSDGSVRELGPDERSGLFAATIGGLGLTGVIAWAEVQLVRVAGAWLETEDIPFHSLDDFFALADASAETHAYTVAWVDCLAAGRELGRGIFSRANDTADPDRSLHGRPRLTVPLDAPSYLLNPMTVRAFNAGYFRLKSARAGKGRAHYAAFYFPLDAIGAWNRIYGGRGFFQYQCVLPQDEAPAATAEALAQIARSGQGSFLAVLKSFGDLPSPGMLSFPMKGVTLALDVPNRGDVTLKLLARLDQVVRQAGGRLYAAKDGRISRAMLHAGYPRLTEFAAHADPGLASGLWKRGGS
ncbi:FAD-binding oxidoreductase [Phenylobacterium sp. LjRoot219]|uniref:FAD-binding oxidoreductase n=1 Tax=Phenylobacterium sp. LjRoot219 TaxID=3342283 RepID=UPI003ECF8932